ncbi:MAG: crotonase/enoyl-CoA hydratase family protein [Pseudomonadota bacterium]|nr:crotonase/enoyl-CoA hydratase family protein [Pseudomonadota bacterium]
MNGLLEIEAAGAAMRIVIDDGKVNAMSIPMLEALHAAFDRAAQEEAGAVILTARGRVFSAGFDLNTLRGGVAEDLHRILTLGAELALKLLTFPRPVVAAVPGAAFPMGAFLVLSSDLRLSSPGVHRIGLNETRIGLAVPRFAVEVARQRLTPAVFNRTVTTGEMFPPDEALAAGFYDRLVPADALQAEAEAAAADLATIPTAFHHPSKLRARAPAIAAIRAAIDEDLTLEAAKARVAARAA